MKKRVLLVSIMALFIFGCNTSETETQIDDPTSAMKELIQNPDFQNAINSSAALRSENSKDENNGNGVMIADTGLFQFFIFSTPDNIIFSYAPDGNFFVKVMSEDKAQFFVRTNEPHYEILDPDWNFMYSNLCDEKKVGHLNVNLTSGYDFLDFGPDFQLYFPAPPFTSANILTASGKVNDAAQIINEFGEIECNEPTLEMKLSITSLFRDNSHNGNEPVIKVTLK